MGDTPISTSQIWKSRRGKNLILRITGHLADNIWSYDGVRFKEGLKKSMKRGTGGEGISGGSGEITESSLRRNWKLVSPKKNCTIHQYNSKLYEVLYNDGNELATIPLGENNRAGKIRVYTGTSLKKFVRIDEKILKRLFLGVRRGI